jgi:hypothetical protein
MASALLLAVVAIGVGGRTTKPSPVSAPVASAAVLVGEAVPPGEAAMGTPSPRSDWPAGRAARAESDPLAERVNKFTIDDQIVSRSRPDFVPRRTHRIGGLANHRRDPSER